MYDDRCPDCKDQIDDLERDVEMAWAAGLWEGEGCFFLRKHFNHQGRGKDYVYAGASIASTDKDVIDRFNEVIGLSVNVRRQGSKKRKESWKPLYVWYVSGVDQVEHLYNLLAPWLGKRRRERAEEVLEEAKNAPHRRVNHAG